MMCFLKIEKCAKVINSHEKKLFKLRKEVNELHFNHHFSKSEIARRKKVSRGFVIQWTKSPNQDFQKDNRGWPKGKMRKYSKADEKRIKKIHHQLVKEPKAFFAGASAILQRWQEKYPKLQPPQPRFVGRVLKKYNLSEKIQKGRQKGASRYLCYPEYSIFNLGASLLEIDFIGKKFIKGRTEPLNFIAFSLRKPRKLKYFKRILGETGDNIIKESKEFFKKFEKPEVVKIDNSFASYGGGSQKRTLTKVILFYLKEGIVPIFAPPKKPWSQASIEGANSVFSRKFWKRFDFKDLKEVDEKLEDFNNSYQWYLGYQSPKERTSKRKFIPKIYFIRKVYQDEKTEKGYIDILNEKVFLPKSYLNFFTLSEWNLKKEKLYVYFEKEQKLNLIKKLSFKIYPRSKEKLQKILQI